MGDGSQSLRAHTQTTRPLALTRVADDALGGYPESGFDQADLRPRIVLPAPEQPRACGHRWDWAPHQPTSFVA